MALTRKFLTPLIVLAVIVVFFGYRMFSDSGYKLTVFVPNATDLVVGGQVRIDGEPVGQIDSIGVAGKSAKIVLSLGGSNAPLHAGTAVSVSWNSLLGRRVVDLTPGPAANPVLPSGAAIVSKTESVELDDIVAALDAPTRAKVKALAAQLNQTIQPNKVTLNEVLKQAGAFVGQLGGVMQGVGQDGPAITVLVTQVRQMVDTLANRHAQLSSTISNLDSLVSAAVQEESQLSAALNEVPATLQTATTFFGKVPGAVNQAIPLLNALQPATSQLPAVAAKLNPILTDLRPTVAQLRPTLAEAQSLLNYTPGLLTNGQQTLPSVNSALLQLQPAVDFLRPYTPEIIGFLTNWTSLFSAKNSAGHFGRALIPASAESFNSNPGVLVPGMTQFKAPAPGSLVGQPWTDASGDGVH